MEVGDEDHVYILDTLEKGQEKIENLREQRDKLKEANDRLVDLVKKLENILAEETEEDFEYEGNEYNYPGQWTPTDIIHEKDLDLKPNYDTEDIDSQISEAIKSLKRVQKFKSK